MKQAKPSEADFEHAFELLRAIDAFTSGCFPMKDDDGEERAFDMSDSKDVYDAMRLLLPATRRLLLTDSGRLEGDSVPSALTDVTT